MIDVDKLINDANEHTVKVNLLIRELEGFKGVMDRVVDEKSVVCVHIKGEGATFIDTVLNKNIVDGIKTGLTNTLESEQSKIAHELQDLIKKSIVPKEKVIEVLPTPAGKKVVELDLEQVRDMYVNKGFTLAKIAEELGCAASTVFNFIKKNKITKEEVKTEPAIPLTVELVRELYTEGSMNLSDTAKYFRVDSKVLHTFIEKNGLKKKVVKPNDPFLDSNKMGKEDFRKQMMAARK